jgi:hypothetical protein
MFFLEKKTKKLNYKTLTNKILQQTLPPIKSYKGSTIFYISNNKIVDFVLFLK